ncbi:MAG: hypothetical protein JRJ26_20660 [Deltaproteobacteria bacterium]|nr:hypothetical protein [Deltaproteobacteria bacterium]
MSSADMGSAERIALSGVKRELLVRPQLDLLIGFLTRFIISELCRLDRPIPRLGYFPFGYRNVVTFSFDDFCPSGRPLKSALFEFTGGLGRAGGVKKALARIGPSAGRIFKEIVGYFGNHEAQTRSLIDLFKSYGAAGSAFILPSLGPVKGKTGLTGYIGFSKKSYQALREAGWDTGTHIKPVFLGDYDQVHRSFLARFGTAPIGHRGHQLGWVDREVDWERLDELGYAYDSTWNWGGEACLTWILGSGFPFHPLDRDGQPLAILEVPVVAWIKDLYQTPEKSLRLIEEMLDRYIGVFNFAAHSWKIADKAYLEAVRVLEAAGAQQDREPRVGPSGRGLLVHGEKQVREIRTPHLCSLVLERATCLRDHRGRHEGRIR